MKIDIAIYTAQEGYAWQPGTVISSNDLKEYKTCIGKFPSPDAPDFPFGGVFLKDDKVVFYRYHVAKKIDFRGRDALYCVLGVVPVSDASKIDPKQLFALPQFAGPVIPFPVNAELITSGTENVPEWLKNLDCMSLDARISGSIDDMKFAVKQEQTKLPEPPKVETPKVEVKVVQPKEEVAPAKAEESVKIAPPKFNPPGYTNYKPRPWYKDRLVIVTSTILAILIAAFVAVILFVVSMIRGCASKPVATDDANKPGIAEVLGSSAVKDKKIELKVDKVSQEDVKSQKKSR